MGDNTTSNRIYMILFLLEIFAAFELLLPSSEFSETNKLPCPFFSYPLEYVDLVRFGDQRSLRFSGVNILSVTRGR